MGRTYVRLWDHRFVTREIFWARYVDWFITTPLLLLDILLIANTSIGETMWCVAIRF